MLVAWFHGFVVVVVLCAPCIVFGSVSDTVDNANAMVPNANLSFKLSITVALFLHKDDTHALILHLKTQSVSNCTREGQKTKAFTNGKST